MRHILKAKEDVNDRIGDRLISAKKGETIELSAAGAEVAMRTGKFEYESEVPETEVEKERAKEAEKIETLAEKPKKTLIRKAAKVGARVSPRARKNAIAEAIVDAENNEPVVGALAPDEEGES